MHAVWQLFFVTLQGFSWHLNILHCPCFIRVANNYVGLLLNWTFFMEYEYALKGSGNYIYGGGNVRRYILIQLSLEIGMQFSDSSGGVSRDLVGAGESFRTFYVALGWLTFSASQHSLAHLHFVSTSVEYESMRHRCHWQFGQHTFFPFLKSEYKLLILICLQETVTASKWDNKKWIIRWNNSVPIFLMELKNIVFTLRFRLNLFYFKVFFYLALYF